MGGQPKPNPKSTGKKDSEYREQVLVEFSKLGYTQTEGNHVKECAAIARDKLFPSLKFVSEDFMRNKMPTKIAKFLNVPKKMMGPTGPWMETWNDKTANACRKAINQKRNDIAGSMREKYQGKDGRRTTS